MTARMVKKRARSWEIYRGIVTSHPGEERGREKVESGERDPRDSPSQFGSEETHRLVSARNIYVAYPPPPPRGK